MVSVLSRCTLLENLFMFKDLERKLPVATEACMKASETDWSVRE